MTVQELREKLKRLPGKTKLIVFPSNVATDEEDNLLPSGLGYLDIETKRFVYVGKITIIEVDDEEDD